MAELIHCIYASALSPGVTESEIAALLQHAREKNARLGLTGMLVFCDQSFFQVLEGPEDVVDAVYEKIEGDNRHCHITKVIRESIDHRHFEEWTMGFTKMTHTDLASLAESNDFFAGGESLSAIDAGRAKKLLTAFRKGRWRQSLSGARQAA
ncbi:MAG: BLUF domain-containing protein [Burkholderiaceae bacterium]